MTRDGKTRPTGFSVIELVMVAFIICMAISLMLPAIQSAREAARRTQCINNLKQLSLALANYETHYRVFPPGVVDRQGPVPSTPAGLQNGWITQLLPYMEQSYMYKVFNPDLSFHAPENRTVYITRISSILCPSDPGAGSTAGPGPSSFAGCHHDVEAPIDADNHGVFFLNSRIGYDDLLDGASFTILVGEKRIDRSGNEPGWMAGTRATLRNTGTAINAETPAGPGDLALVVGGFSSFHPGGANFAFGDGSVRFVSESVDATVYRYLGHRADGELISDARF